MERTESITNLAAALAKAQSEMRNPLNNADNPFFKSKYAPLDALINCTKPVLAANGITVIQYPSAAEHGINVTTMLLHESGEYITFDPINVCPVKDDPQGVGSAITYARRYALAAALNICGEDDDDGNSASGKTPQKKSDAPIEVKATAEQIAALRSFYNTEELMTRLLKAKKLEKLEDITLTIAADLIKRCEEKAAASQQAS